MALVLVIEDNPANMKLAVFLMTVAGHEVLQAVDAEAGIALARERHPRLILMDIQLPGMDGLAATQLLKRETLTSDIKIIALTALAMSGDRQKIEAAGCDGYLAKPIRYHELLNLVGSIMPF
jgi:two-component system cell cycle response regulator DivK